MCFCALVQRNKLHQALLLFTGSLNSWFWSIHGICRENIKNIVRPFYQICNIIHSLQSVTHRMISFMVKAGSIHRAILYDIITTKSDLSQRHKRELVHLQLRLLSILSAQLTL